MSVSRTSETMEQAEIDRLLGGAASSSSPHIPRVTGVDLQVYDFRRPHRVSKERLRTLEVMYERLVKSLEGWLMARVRGQIELRLQSVEQISFGEYSLFLNSPCCSYLISIKDAGGQQGVNDHRFCDAVLDPLAGVECGERVLKDDAHIFAQFPQLVAL